jgi:hypothetical protein
MHVSRPQFIQSFRILPWGTVTKNYMLRFRCAQGDADEILILQNRNETLEQIQNSSWHFECPVHGVQKEIPIETKEINAPVSLEVHPTIRTASGRALKARRRSKRIHLRIPVAVYGQNRAIGAFREETATDIVNAHGGLVALSSRVALGEIFLVVNRATQEEQQCRVVYVGPLEGQKNKIGFALLRSAPYFWRVDFPPTS